ncbi:MAG: hydrogenase nickel incorporation protein HypB [Bacteroidetes bacterium]|nr:hydrogenase nickel incorporation protein HypB [Bacteroidota bacterium]
MAVITVERKVLEKNDEIARSNRALFKHHNVFVLNLVSSPGAGKTTLLEQTLDRLRTSIKSAVIEGDVQTDIDAQRIARFGVPVVQLVTNGSCHLDAMLVRDALQHIDLSTIDILFIENVGNLVCPAGYDLGETMKVVVVSVTEGDDKPLKYPAMFRNASILVINKVDLLPYVPSNIELLRANATKINPQLTIFEVSCSKGNGLDSWCSWLRQNISVNH